MANLDFIIKGDNTNFVRSLDDALKATTNTTKAIEAQGQNLDEVFSTVGNTIKGAFAVAAIEQFASKIIDVRKEFQSLQQSFSSLLGSDTKGMAMFDEITKFATTTPLLERDIASAAQTLIGFNIEAEKVIPTLKAIGNVSMGDSQRFQALTLAFAQVSSAGKLMGQDLMQMINAGFNPLGELSRTTGKSMAELKDEMSKGAITAEVLEQAFVSATSEGGKFFGMLETQSKTLKGAMSNLEGAIEKFYNALGESVEDDIVESTTNAFDAINELTEYLEGNEFAVGHMEKVLTVLRNIVIAYGGWKAAELATAAVRSAAASQDQRIAVQRNNALQSIINKYTELTEVERREASVRGTTPQEHTNAETAALEQKIAVMQQEIALQVKKAMMAERGAKTALASAQQEVVAAQQRVIALEHEQRILPLFASAEDRAAKASEIKAAKTALASAKEKEAAAATQLYTITEERQALVTRKNTLATELQATATTKATLAQKLFATASNGVAAAWRSMTAAMAANPIGAVITIVTLAASAMMMFDDSVSESALTIERFGKTAKKELDNVETLFAVLRNTSETSNVHKKALDELIGIYDEYGIVIDKENTKLAESIAKYNELTSAIRQNGEEKRKAARIAAYEEALEKARKNLSDTLLKTYQDASLNGTSLILDSASSLQKNADLAAAIMAEVAESEVEGLQKIIRDGGKVTNEEIAKVIANIEKVSRTELARLASDPSEALTISLYGLDIDYNKILNDYIQSTIALTTAQKESSDATAENTGKMEEQSKQIDLSAMSLEDLRKTAILTDEDVAKLAKEEVDIKTDIKDVKTLDDAITKAQKEVDTLSAQVAAPGADTSHIDVLTSKLQTAKRLLDALNNIRSKGVTQEQKVDAWKNKADSAFTNKAQADLIKELNEELDSVDQRTPYYKELMAIKDKVEKRKKEAAGNGSKSGKKSGSKGKSVAEKIADEEEKLTELMLDKARDTKRATEDMETKITEARLAIHADGAAKLKAQREEERRKEMQDLQRRKEDAVKAAVEREKRIYEQEQKIAKLKNPKAKQTTFEKNAEAQKKVAEVTKQVTDQYDELAKLASQKANKAIADAELEAMNNFLQQYGSYQEQKLAIAQEYADKIAKAETEGEKKSLAKERDAKLSEKNAQQIAQSIDWGTAFSGVGHVLQDIAKETLGKVEEYMKTTEFKNLTADSKKSYVDLRNKLREETGAGATSPFNFKIYGQIEKQAETYQKSVKKFQDAQDKHSKAVKDLAKAQEDLANTTNDIDRQYQEGVVKAAKERVNATKNAQDQAESDKNDAEQNLTESTNAAAQGLENFASYLSEMGNGSLYGFANGVSKLVTSLMKGSDGVGKGLSELGGKIGGIIGAILQILDALGDDPAKFFDDLLGRVRSALSSLIEDLPKVVVNIVSQIGGIIGGIIEGIGSWFGLKSGWLTGSNEREVNKTTEKLTKSNERLQHSIDKLKEEIKESGGANAMSSYQKARQMQEQANKNSLDILKAQMGYHAAHHSNAYYFNLDKQTWSTISAIVGKKVATLDQLLSLSPEDMDKIRTNAPSIWQMILEQGQYDKSEYWENYADQADKLKELAETISETLTQTSFDSLRDSFLSSLMDMDKSAAEFADDFKEYMMKAVLNGLLADKLDSKIKDWYEHWSKAMEGGLDEQEERELLNEWNTIVDKGLELRNEAMAITGYNGTSQQEATANGATSVTYDQANQLIGRITAIQIQGEQRNAMTTAMLSSLQSMAAATVVSGSAVTDIRNMLAIANTYLEDIVKYAKASYGEFGTKLDNINNSIKAL